MDISDLLAFSTKNNASDLHLSVCLATVMKQEESRGQPAWF